MSNPFPGPIRERLSYGLALGGGLAIYGGGLLILILILGLVTEGSPEVRLRGALVRVDLLVLVYPLGAILWGLLFAVFLPLMRWVIPAFLFGSVAMAPFAFGIVVTMERGYAAWVTMHTAVASGVSVLLGGTVGCILGPALMRKEKARRRPRSTQRR